MNNIFKKKKSCNNNELNQVVVVEKRMDEVKVEVEVEKGPDLNEQDKQTESKSTTNGKKFRTRFFFSLSKPKKKENEFQPDDELGGSDALVNEPVMAVSESSLCSSDCLTVKRNPSLTQPQDVEQNGSGSYNKSSKQANKKQWSRHSKSSPPPPPPPTSTPHPKSNGTVVKSPAPLPPGVTTPNQLGQYSDLSSILLCEVYRGEAGKNAVRLSLQNPPSALKLKNWNLAYRLLIIIP